MTILLFVLGLIALVAGAEVLVRGASKLALSFGIAPLVVGLTVVAFGTSSPEMAVSVQVGLVRASGHRLRQRDRQQHLQRFVHPRHFGADHAAAGGPAAHPPGGADHDRHVIPAAGPGMGRRDRRAGMGRSCLACSSATPSSSCARAERRTRRSRRSTSGIWRTPSSRRGTSIGRRRPR